MNSTNRLFVGCAIAVSAIASPSLAAPYFEDVTASAFPPPGCENPDDKDAIGCYTNFLVISDVDGDGDLDILFANGGGYYEPGNAEPSTVYLNDGQGGFRDATETSFGLATSRLRQVAVADVDGDGDFDVYQPGGYGVDDDKLFIQTAPAKFENKAVSNLPPGMRSRAGSAHFGDLDGDGDVDLAVGDWGVMPRMSPGNTFIYLNDGKGVFSALPASAVPAPIEVAEGTAPIDLDLADIDGDFDLDILVNHRNGRSRIFLNDGKAGFTESEHLYPEKKGPYTYNVEACDFDEDGDLDLLLDNAGGTMKTDDGPRNLSQVLVNDGHGSFSDDTAMRITGEPMGDDNAVKCADLNGDGHYDLLVASLTNPTEKLLINDGKGHFTNVADGFPMVVDPTLGIDVGDLDGDGLLDVVTGQGEGTPRIDRIYKGAGASKKDVTAPKFRAVEKPAVKPDTPIVLRLAVVDAYTSETGEHVSEVSVEYQADGGASKKAKAHFIGGDLFRVTIPAQPSGTKLKLTAHAIDRAGLTGSAKPFELMIGEPRPPVRDEPDSDAGVMIDAGSMPPTMGMEPSRSDAGLVDAGSVETPPESGGGAGSMCVALSRVKLTAATTPTDDSGCSVVAPGGRTNHSAVALLGGCMLVLLGMRLRRRRGLRGLSPLLLLAIAACSDDDADAHGMQAKPVEEEEDAGYWCPPIETEDAGPDKAPPQEETPRDSGMAAAGAGGAPPSAGAGGGPSRDGNVTPDAGAPDAGGSSMAPDTAAVMRGEAIVMTNTCNGCHQASFAGKGFFPNITQDKDTGIGGWTDDEIKRAITMGVDDQGETLCNLMKRYPFSASELTDLVAFLRSVPGEVNSIGDVCPGHGM